MRCTCIFQRAVCICRNPAEAAASYEITAEMIASNVPAHLRVAPLIAQMSIIDDIYAFSELLRSDSVADTGKVQLGGYAPTLAPSRSQCHSHSASTARVSNTAATFIIAPSPAKGAP